MVKEVPRECFWNRKAGAEIIIWKGGSSGADDKWLRAQMMTVKKYVKCRNEFPLRQVARCAGNDYRSFGNGHVRILPSKSEMIVSMARVLTAVAVRDTLHTGRHCTIDRKNNRDMGAFYVVSYSYSHLPKKQLILESDDSGDNQTGYSSGENSSLPTPHWGQTQSSGRSSNAVPAAMPLSGSPYAGS